MDVFNGEMFTDNVFLAWNHFIQCVSEQTVFSAAVYEHRKVLMLRKISVGLQSWWMLLCWFKAKIKYSAGICDVAYEYYVNGKPI